MFLNFFSKFTRLAIVCISVVVISLILSVGIRVVLAGWEEPKESPPGGDIAAPLNVSSATQTKTGGLNIQGEVSVGNIEDTKGKVTIFDKSEPKVIFNSIGANDWHLALDASGNRFQIGTGDKFAYDNNAILTMDPATGVGIKKIPESGYALDVDGAMRVYKANFPKYVLENKHEYMWSITLTDDEDYPGKGFSLYDYDSETKKGTYRFFIDSLGKAGIGPRTARAAEGLRGAVDINLDVKASLVDSFQGARGIYLDSTLTATNNEDKLIGLHIDPEFYAGSKKDVKKYGLIVESGQVGIGKSDPDSGVKLDVYGSETTDTTAIQGSSDVRGIYGYGEVGYGIVGYSPSGIGIYGKSDSNYAGYFEGKLKVTDNIITSEDIVVTSGQKMRLNGENENTYLTYKSDDKCIEFWIDEQVAQRFGPLGGACQANCELAGGICEDDLFDCKTIDRHVDDTNYFCPFSGIKETCCMPGTVANP